MSKLHEIAEKLHELLGKIEADTPNYQLLPIARLLHKDLHVFVHGEDAPLPEAPAKEVVAEEPVVEAPVVEEPVVEESAVETHAEESAEEVVAPVKKTRTPKSAE